MIFVTEKFRYCNIPQLQDEGMDTDLTDAQVLKIIEAASKLINRMTDQWFYPIETTFKQIEEGCNIITLPNLIPIIKLNNVKIDDDEIDSESYNFDMVNLTTIEQQRIIKYKNFNTEFVGELSIDGIFGYLERRSYNETTTSTAVNSSSTNVTVVDASKFKVNDVLIFDDGVNDKFKTICTQVDKSGNKLYFADVDDETEIDSGAKVYRYGQVPTLINRACKILVLRSLFELASENLEEQDLANRLISETTDRYSYRLSPNGSGEGGANYSTGITEVDRILTQFTPPPLVKGI